MIDLGLNVEGSVDYWYDEGFLESRRRLASLNSEQWSELSQMWPSQPADWQERLAYILGDEAIPREVELLVEMFTSGNAGASLSAAEALRSITFEQFQSLLSSAWVARSISPNGLLSCRTVNELLNEVKSRKSRRSEP